MQDIIFTITVIRNIKRDVDFTVALCIVLLLIFTVFFFISSKPFFIAF
jgi:hypothetical protein